MKLPAEIRCEIYKYVAAAENAPKKGKAKVVSERHGLAYHIAAGEVKNQASIMPPGLFRTCTQVYMESRYLFYRHHPFKLQIWHEEKRSKSILERLAEWVGLWRHTTCLDRTTRWLDAIGGQTLKQIRILEIEVHPWSATGWRAYVRFIDDLHARLSDETTLVYRSTARGFEALDTLWALGKMFYDRDPSRVPQFEYPGWYPGLIPTGLFLAGITPGICPPLPSRRLGSRPSLIFGPGLGWFDHGSR